MGMNSSMMTAMTFQKGLTVGNMSRDKGKRGQKEFAAVLVERGWVFMESSAGAEEADFLGVSPGGTVYAIEVKHHKIIALGKFIAQAREQASRRKSVEWLLACRLDGYPSTFLVLSSDGTRAVWSGRAIPVT